MRARPGPASRSADEHRAFDSRVEEADGVRGELGGERRRHARRERRVRAVGASLWRLLQVSILVHHS